MVPEPLPQVGHFLVLFCHFLLSVVYRPFVLTRSKYMYKCIVMYNLQWLEDISGRIADLGVFESHSPNHVLVNKYLPGQGIMVSALALDYVLLVMTIEIFQ